MWPVAAGGHLQQHWGAASCPQQRVPDSNILEKCVPSRWKCFGCIHIQRQSLHLPMIWGPHRADNDQWQGLRQEQKSAQHL